MAVRGPPPPSPSATAYSAASGLSAYQSPYRGPGAPGSYQAPPVPSMPQMSQMPLSPTSATGMPPMGQMGMGGMGQMGGMQGQQQAAGASPGNYDKFRGFFEQLRMFLASEDVKEVPGARADPRSKLVKLNEAQFMELSTDVHDECIRRNSPNPTPFLPLRQELHPKRNQARQKLATLSKTKFRDLASDIFYELGRRFPAFRGQGPDRPETPTSMYDDPQSPLSNAYGGGGNNSSSTAPSSIPPSLAAQSDRLASDSASGSTRGTTPTFSSKLESPFAQGGQRGQYGEDDSNPMVRRRPSEASTNYALEQGRRSGESARTADTSTAPSVWRRPSDKSGVGLVQGGERRRPSVEQLTLRANQQPQGGLAYDSPAGQAAGPGNSAFSPPPTGAATIGVVNPMKSTMAEEEIEVPYGHDSDELNLNRPGSLASAASERDREREREMDREMDRTDQMARGMGRLRLVGGGDESGEEEEEEEEEEEGSRGMLTGPTTASTLREGGLNALAGGFGFDEPGQRGMDSYGGAGSGGGTAPLSVRNKDASGPPSAEERYRVAERDGESGAVAMGMGAGLMDDEEQSTASRGVSEFYDKMSFGRASVASSAAGGGGHAGGRESGETEKLRREYEFKIATMSNRVQSLEAELGETVRGRDASVQQLQAVKEEMSKVRDLANDQAAEVARLKKELEEARASKDRDLDDNAQRAQQAEAELALVTENFERFKFEQSMKEPEGDPLADNLRAEVQQLVNELNELSDRNEEMMHEKDNDAAIIRDLNAQIREWKRKYENAKTELRHLKATSTQVPKLPIVDPTEHLPTSDNGAIQDVHVTAFQSSIDALLAAGRSSQPTSVLSAMKNVVTAVAAITDDVRSFEMRSRKERVGVDEDAVRALKDRASATLNNLVMASKNHGTSYGLSPVSLLDAAASHVSSTIVEIVRMLKIRRSTRTFLERTGSKQTNIYPLNNSPDRDNRIRSNSQASAGRDNGSGADRNSGPSPIRTNPAKRRSTGMSAESHNNGLPTPDRSTPTNQSLQYLPMDSMQYRPPVPGLRDDEVVPTEGSDDAWAELKPYLEAQSESIVYHIQTVLSGIRNGAKAADLNDSLTQIITIVSSIVAVCKDSLPSASARQGQELLRELSEHCNTLSEAQVMGGEVSKQMRQAMATASFGVAKALKELMKL